MVIIWWLKYVCLLVKDLRDYNDGKMSVLRIKRSIQTLTLAMILVYTTLLLYQSLSRGPIQPSQQVNKTKFRSDSSMISLIYEAVSKVLFILTDCKGREFYNGE